MRRQKTVPQEVPPQPAVLMRSQVHHQQQLQVLQPHLPVNPSAIPPRAIPNQPVVPKNPAISTNGVRWEERKPLFVQHFSFPEFFISLENFNYISTAFCVIIYPLSPKLSYQVDGCFII